MPLNHSIPTRNSSIIAEEAARLMFVEAIEGYGEARRKTCEKLGIAPHTPGLPDAADIDRALQALQRQCWDEETAREWRTRLMAAIKVVQSLKPFSPRLVGALTRGIVLPIRCIQLHAFAEQPEELIWTLSERGIATESDERRYADPQARSTRGKSRTHRQKSARASTQTFPMIRFCGPLDVDVEVTVFAPGREHHSPPSPIDGRPIPRLDQDAIERLIAAPPLAPVFQSNSNTGRPDAISGPETPQNAMARKPQDPTRG
ncbi:MAG: hypothetical protein ACK4IT_08100 [Thioalkalivibrionaceae bacterium]